MAWIVGIDEAGYGPNLGPFVMASAACRVPDEWAAGNLWELLREAVRRQHDFDDGRLHVEDSKVVYSTRKGLKALERGVLAVFGNDRPGAGTLGHWVDRLCPAAHAHLREEAWYTGVTPLPVHADPAELGHCRERFRRACTRSEVVFAPCRATVVCPPHFNAVLDRCGSKGVVLMLAFTELLRQNLAPDDGDEPVLVFVDKHGGRDNYQGLLQEALPEGSVLALCQGRDCSTYEVQGLRRPLRLTFTPRADLAHLCVSLASMAAKYLRELLMLEFNQFWRNHLPDLKPTAGYPGDALRYFETIRPVAQTLGLHDDQVWRKK